MNTINLRDARFGESAIVLMTQAKRDDFSTMFSFKSAYHSDGDEFYIDDDVCFVTTPGSRFVDDFTMPSVFEVESSQDGILIVEDVPFFFDSVGDEGFATFRFHLCVTELEFEKALSGCLANYYSQRLVQGLPCCNGAAILAFCRQAFCIPDTLVVGDLTHREFSVQWFESQFGTFTDFSF